MHKKFFTFPLKTARMSLTHTYIHQWIQPFTRFYANQTVKLEHSAPIQIVTVQETVEMKNVACEVTTSLTQKIGTASVPENRHVYASVISVHAAQYLQMSTYFMDFLTKEQILRMKTIWSFAVVVQESWKIERGSQIFYKNIEVYAGIETCIGVNLICILMYYYRVKQMVQSML